MIHLDRQQTYLVESDSDGTVLLALWPKLEADRVEWFDTVRDRGFRVRAAHEEDGAVVVETERHRYRFRPLDLTLYRERVQHRVDGRPEFASTEAVQAFYARFAAG